MKKLEFSKEQWAKITDAVDDQTIWDIENAPFDYLGSGAPYTTVCNLMEQYDYLSLHFEVKSMKHIETYERETARYENKYSFILDCFEAVYINAEGAKTYLTEEFCNTINEYVGEIKISK